MIAARSRKSLVIFDSFKPRKVFKGNSRISTDESIGIIATRMIGEYYSDFGATLTAKNTNRRLAILGEKCTLANPSSMTKPLSNKTDNQGNITTWC
jgi:hypothetical protein